MRERRHQACPTLGAAFYILALMSLLLREDNGGLRNNKNQIRMQVTHTAGTG